MLDKLSFVIPCYRSSGSIENVVEEIETTVQNDGRYSFEIILVNDASPDDTYTVLESIASSRNHVKVIDLARNFGQHSALMAGLNHCEGDFVFCLDDDGQTPASELFTLLNRLLEGFDLVIARYTEKKHSTLRKIGTKINGLMAEVLIGKPKNLYLSSYFVCRRFIVDEMIKYQYSFPYVAGLYLRSTKNITNVEITHRERVVGESGYRLRSMVGLWLNGFTSFSVKPLRIAVILGLLSSGFGFIYGGFTIVRKLLRPDIAAGFTSIIAAQFFIGGVIMFLLGIIGEYVGRLFVSLNRNPQYVIRRTINLKEESK